MSELTPCNRCTLERMRRAARQRGADVIVTVVTDPDDPMRGWTAARYTDHADPSSYFQVLTEACAC